MADPRFDSFVQLFSVPVVIFDFDGVLVDSERHHMASYNAVFQKYGHTLDPVEYAKYWTSLGHGPKGEIERHKLKIDPNAIRREKRPIFSELCRNGTVRFFPEARELVSLLVGAGKELAIASGTMKRDIVAILENEGLLETFGSIVGSDIAALKPDPESFLTVLADVNASPSEAVVVEDAEKGVSAAIAADIPVVVVRTPETSAIDFSAANLVLDSHAELVEFARRAFS
ncbi:MAG TPA: HAD family phosphatase [Candidatus Krumholzibacteria bacterium]|nr:HAD family phosphatase [Candidatus Krumholzibacteria bacterium]